MTINGNRPELDGYYVLRDKMNDRRHWDSSHPEYESYNAEIRKGFEALYGGGDAAQNEPADNQVMNKYYPGCRGKTKCDLGELGIGSRWHCTRRLYARDGDNVVHKCNERKKEWKNLKYKDNSDVAYRRKCSDMCEGINTMLPRCCKNNTS